MLAFLLLLWGCGRAEVVKYEVQYIRLNFATEDYVFFDFEALGVDVHAVVTRKAVGKKPAGSETAARGSTS